MVSEVEIKYQIQEIRDALNSIMVAIAYIEQEITDGARLSDAIDKEAI